MEKMYVLQLISRRVSELRVIGPNGQSHMGTPNIFTVPLWGEKF